MRWVVLILLSILARFILGLWYDEAFNGGARRKIWQEERVLKKITEDYEEWR